MPHSKILSEVFQFGFWCGKKQVWSTYQVDWEDDLKNEDNLKNEDDIKNEDIFMQRRLYIDEAHTALDIFRFAVFFGLSLLAKFVLIDSVLKSSILIV